MRLIQKISLLFITISLCSIALFACKQENVELSITNNIINLTIDDTEVIVYQTNSDAKPSFTSSDDSIATVNDDGKVTAVALGTAEITVKIADTTKTAIVKVISAELLAAKEDANKQISDLVASLNESDYSAVNWIVILTRAATAHADIANADTALEVTNIVNSAISDINGIGKIT